MRRPARLVTSALAALALVLAGGTASASADVQLGLPGTTGGGPARTT